MSEFVLPKLEYALDALAPAMSEETLQYHYGKHHQTYINNLNAQIRGTSLEHLSLKEIVKTTSGPIFNNAAQTFNHAFFWKCLSPNGGGEPTGPLAAAISAKWGSFAAFRKAFSDAAAAQFGSGWAWLVMTPSGGLAIVTYPNAGTPIARHEKPIIGLDVWEHAYYIDYRNNRGKYIEVFFDKLVNWKFAEARFAGEPAGCECRESDYGY